MSLNKLPVVAFMFLITLCNIKVVVGQPHLIRWAIQKNSTLNVAGQSNVNSFTCNISVAAQKDTILCFSGPLNIVHLAGDMELDVMAFNCHSGMITKDMQKTLKADQYPKMTIRFISLRSMPVLQGKTEVIYGWVEVNMAGVKKIFELHYTFLSKSSGYIELNGTRSFNFSDFNLVPPRKFAGLVRIKDAFDVSFQLVLRPV